MPLTKTSKFVGFAVAISLTASPVAAAEIPVVSKVPAQVETGAPDDADNHRYRYRRHRNRVDVGDVIAGVAIIGAIAAIAGSGRRDRDRYEPRYRDRGYRADRYDSRGMERAVDMCIDNIERGRDRVDEIDNASRGRDGWRVSGTLEGGGGWNCFIDNDGRIRDIDLGADYSRGGNDGAYAGAQGGSARAEQWSDGAYARARASTRTAADGEYTYPERQTYELPDDSGPQPEYPGGPIPGEADYAQLPDAGANGEWEDDGRYDTAQSPGSLQAGS